MEKRSPVIAKKLWNILRIVFCMLKKGIPKSKLMVDLHMMFKRGKLAGKAIMLHLHQEYYYSSVACRSTDVRMSIVPRREYEFSCSNSPVYPSYFSKRSRNHNHHDNYNNRYKSEEMNVVHKVFDMLSNGYHENMADANNSPMVALPGFGQSPMVRQLRVTDSPFPVKEYEENPQVDKDAEEFIKKFYKQLKQQGRVAALESPSPYHKWAV